MKDSKLEGVLQVSEDAPMVVTTDNGELLLLAGDGSGAELAGDGAEIVVVETDDGQQQIQLVTEDGGRVLALPPELASRLKESLSDLVTESSGLQQLTAGAEDRGEEGEPEEEDEQSQEEVEEEMEEVIEEAAEVPEEGVEVEDGAIELPEGAVVLSDGAVELPEGAVVLPEGAVVLEAGGVEVAEEGAELPEGAVVLSDGTVELPEGAVVLETADELPEGSVELQSGEEGADGPNEQEEITLPDKVEEASSGDEGEAKETAVDENGSASAGEDTANDEQREDDGSGRDVDFMKVEEQSVTSGDEHVEEEHVKEDVGEFLGDLGFAGRPKMEESSIHSAEETNDADPEWTESTVTSASGAQVTIRLPTVAVLDAASTASSCDGDAAPEQPGPSIRLIRLSENGLTEVPAQTPTAAERRERSRAEEEAWAVRTRRRASRGIARAVAAVRRAEDSDSFESEEEEEPPPPPPVDKTKRGRGRPRKAGGFSCQLCPRRLQTQPEFFQHLRDHYEKPDGEGAEGVSAEGEGATEESSEQLEPIAEESEHDGAGERPAVINVDIIAAESGAFECDDCDMIFYSEDELEKHKKTHIEVMPTQLEADESELMEQGGEEGAVSAGEEHAEPVPESTQSDGDGKSPVVEFDPAAAEQYEMKNLKKCNSCPKVFTTLASLRNHRLRMHNDGEPVSVTNAAKHEYECAECHVTYTSYKIHLRHMRLHEDKAAGRLSHRCSTCGASFLTGTLLSHHVQREHPERCRRPAASRPAGVQPRPNGRPPGSANKARQAVYDQIQETEHGTFRCMICSIERKSKNQMFYHISMKHKALDGHKCETCGKAFFTDTARRVHERTHTGERPYGCDFCARRFRQQADLNAHVMSIHTQERPYRCRFCSKSFSRKYSLTVHMRCHTNERNYKCHICNKGFRASTYLTGHMKIHSGERSHACPICYKTFRMRSDMKRHIFTHSRERPQPRSLRSLNVEMAGNEEGGVVLLDPSQLCLQLVSQADGDAMVITEGNQTMVLDGSQTVIDERTGQLMVPESAISELDETAMASMYLLADSQSEAMELT
ncbi:zinc finger protein 184-like [Amphibalanus amphitrite]|uniref:zinc finger protein 184-like n=1 Tax=Amphibalanus amphitrite TaxID=1232801 RepID=UPI001C91E397|nr:zinc finger protein 184-like [Amphibalanus amphitrite]XP_043214714.1 zinc finger protein 184-like [Amphibalanus amphitrite]